MSDKKLHSANPIFEDAAFTFPEIRDKTIRGESGAYNSLLDAMRVNILASELAVSIRVGHEVAHRLLAVDGPALRLARHLAGALYSFIWFFMGKVAEYQAELTGVAAHEIKVNDSVAFDEATVFLKDLLGYIRNLQGLLTHTLKSVQVVYELTAIEFGIRMMEQQIEPNLLVSIEKTLVNAAARHLAPVLYRLYPYYWLEKQLESKNAAQDEREKAIDELLRQLEKGDPGYFPQNRTLYEERFKEMYNSYKRILDEEYDNRLKYTNYGIGTPLDVQKDKNGKLFIDRVSPDFLWTTGWWGPREAFHESEEIGPWRVAQLLEIDTRRLPEYYRTPMYLMTSLDFLLFEQHQEVSTEADYGEKGKQLGGWETFIPGLALKYYPSLLTFLPGDTSDSSEVRLNEKLLTRGRELFGLETDWWRWLLLFETVRVALKTGRPQHCPLRDYNLKCSDQCPIRDNLEFLSAHSQMVAEPFCKK